MLIHGCHHIMISRNTIWKLFIYLCVWQVFILLKAFYNIILQFHGSKLLYKIHKINIINQNFIITIITRNTQWTKNKNWDSQEVLWIPDLMLILLYRINYNNSANLKAHPSIYIIINSDHLAWMFCWDCLHNKKILSLIK